MRLETAACGVQPLGGEPEIAQAGQPDEGFEEADIHERAGLGKGRILSSSGSAFGLSFLVRCAMNLR
jgi:hypothetical protein